MKIDSLQKKLLAAARTIPPDDRVPYAFEQRIMARIKAMPKADPLALWTAALWRATVPCVGVMVVICAVNFFYSGSTTSADNQVGYLEAALTQPLNDTGETW